MPIAYLGISKVAISRFSFDENKVRIADQFTWSRKVDGEVDEKRHYFDQVLDIDYLELFEENYYVDTNEMKLSNKQRTLIYDNKIRSLLAFPLKSSHKLIGVLYFVDRDKKRRWRDYERNLLNGYASLISIKFQNMKLKSGGKK